MGKKGVGTEEQIEFETVKDIDYYGGLDEAELYEQVNSDYLERRSARRPYELQWQLNMNFLIGNQYCSISARGDIEEDDKQYFWQEREVFNHIAPIVESRLAKLGRVRPKIAVLPASSEESDIHTAKVSTGVVDSVYHKQELDKKIKEATLWSETCGTVFYKSIWDLDGGRAVAKGKRGELFKEGDVAITVVPPFEIFPDSGSSADIDECMSIIHAKPYPVDVIKDTWGVEVTGGDVDIMNLDSLAESGGGLGYTASVPKLSRTVKHDHAIVIERYEKPSKDYPLGRLIIAAGGKILYIGALPYQTEEDGARGFPFVRQCAVEQAGSFWGVSVIERSIPIQRAYNAVKNRKHEFLNRAALGVVAVEDGAVDTDNLAEEGLSPGKVVVYRQGANPPVFMDTGRIPADFTYEEDRLLNEFISVTGVSEIMRNGSVPNSVSSGVGLQLLIEQDDTRLAVTADNIRQAVKRLGKSVLRLFKQYAGLGRVSRIVGENGQVSIIKWRASDITSDDVVITTENELSDTPMQRRSFLLELLGAGLLNDENGKLSDHMRHKVLEALGVGGWENMKNLEGLHIKRAQEENQKLSDDYLEPMEIDDHALHLVEHTRFMLGGEYSKQALRNKRAEKNFLRHIRHHRNMAMIAEKVNAEMGAIGGGYADVEQ